MYSLLFKKYLFSQLVSFGCIGSSLLHAGFSLVAVSRGYSLLWCAGFSLRWLLLLWSTGSRRVGFSSCGMRAQQLWLAGSRAQAQQLWRTGLVDLRHVESSQTRARTRVPCIGRRILNHCATRKVPPPFFFYHKREHVISGYIPRNGIAGSYGSSIFNFYHMIQQFHSRVYIQRNENTNLKRYMPMIEYYSAIKRMKFCLLQHCGRTQRILRLVK